MWGTHWNILYKAAFPYEFTNTELRASEAVRNFPPNEPVPRPGCSKTDQVNLRSEKCSTSNHAHAKYGNSKGSQTGPFVRLETLTSRAFRKIIHLIFGKEMPGKWLYWSGIRPIGLRTTGPRSCPPYTKENIVEVCKPPIGYDSSWSLTGSLLAYQVYNILNIPHCAGLDGECNLTFGLHTHQRTALHVSVYI